MRTYVHQKAGIRKFIEAAFVVTSSLKLPTWPSTIERKMNWAIFSRRQIIQQREWTNQGSMQQLFPKIILSERSQLEKNTYWMTSLKCISKTGKMVYLWSTGNSLLLHLGAGYMSVFSLWKCIKPHVHFSMCMVQFQRTLKRKTGKARRRCEMEKGRNEWVYNYQDASPVRAFDFVSLTRNTRQMNNSPGKSLQL